ncbi:MAG: aldehyde dehydrogenase family protein [Novosphingobium sp.]
MQHAGFVDGVMVEGRGETLVVQDPSTEEEFARFSGLSPEQVEAAILAARAAYDSGSWSAKPTAERAEILRRFVAALEARRDRLADLIAREAGCPRHSASMTSQVAVPLRQMPEVIDLFLSLPEAEDNPLPLDHRVTAQGSTVQSFKLYASIGVVSAIAAYNFPFLTALWKVVPALIAGNTVVLRPSPLTPLSALVLGEAAAEAGLPAGVLNIVLEPGLEGGRLMSTHPAVDMVTFTGSSGVGVQIAQQAAPTMKRVQLELGGKSAQIFLPDRVDLAARMAAVVCTSHAGQGCALGTRLFVPEDRKAEVIEQIAREFAAIRVGPTDDAQTQLGPVISAGQRDRCAHFVELAVANGGRVVAGGKRPAHLDKGFFFEATVLDVPDNSNPAAQEEIFGPVVTLIGYRDLDHAVAMANDSKFGLSGFVHGQDRATALKVGRAIKTGTVNVNAGIMSSYISAGGQRMSGLGRERGVEGLRIYQQLGCLNLGG